MEKVVLNMLKTYFDAEVSNMVINENEIFVSFDDGSKAKITTKKIA